MQLISSQPAVFFNFFPARSFHIGQQCFETFGEGLNKFTVNRRDVSCSFALEQILQNAFDCRHVSIHAHGEIQIGKGLALTKQRKGQLQRIRVILGIRINHPHQTHLG